MLRTGSSASLFVLFGQSQASIIPNKRGKLMQLRKERTVIVLGFYSIRGKLQLRQTSVNILQTTFSER